MSRKTAASGSPNRSGPAQSRPRPVVATAVPAFDDGPSLGDLAELESTGRKDAFSDRMMMPVQIETLSRARPTAHGRPLSIADADPRVAAEHKKKLSRRAVMAGGGSAVGISAFGGIWIVLRVIGAGARGINSLNKTAEREEKQEAAREEAAQAEADRQAAAARHRDEYQAREQARIQKQQEINDRIFQDQQQRAEESARQHNEAMQRQREAWDERMRQQREAMERTAVGAGQRGRGGR